METSKFGAIKCQLLRLKCTKVDFPGALPQTPLGKLTALLQTPQAVFKAACLGKKWSIGREREE